MKPSIALLFAILFNTTVAMEAPVITMAPQEELGVFGPFEELNIFTLVYQGGSLVFNRPSLDKATVTVNNKEAPITEAEVKELYLLASATARTLKMLPAGARDEMFSISINSPNGSLIVVTSMRSVAANHHFLKLKSKLEEMKNEK